MNSFFSLKVGSRRTKPIISRQKLVNRDKKIVVIVAAMTAGVLTFSFSIGQRIAAINRDNNKVLNGPVQTASGQEVGGLNEISERVDARKDAGTQLRESFDAFSGNRNNEGWSQIKLACLPEQNCQPEDVDPVRTILDALPSQYDQGAMTWQLQEFFNRLGYQPNEIGPPLDGSPGDSWMEVPIEISLEVGANEALELIRTLDKSIRPMVIRQVRLGQGTSSAEGEWSMTIAFTTYYQPEVELQLSKVIIPKEGSGQPPDPDTPEDN